MKISNHNKPTPAKWVKLGTAFVAMSGVISASSFAADKDVLGYIGIGLSLLGVFLLNFFGDENKSGRN